MHNHTSPQDLSSDTGDFPALPISPSQASFAITWTKRTSILSSAATFPFVYPAPGESATSPAATYASIAHSSSSSCTIVASLCKGITLQPKISEMSLASTSTTVVHQPIDDLYTMIRQQRQELSQGPTITIHKGANAVAGIFKRVAMAASPVLHKYFVENAESLEYAFQDHVASSAVNYLLNTWMGEIRDVFEVYAVPAQNSFLKNVSLLRAARMIGMESYTRHILEKYVVYLNNNPPTYEQIVWLPRVLN
jgi:hypothetical protein